MLADIAIAAVSKGTGVLDLKMFDEDIYNLIFRLAVNIVFMTIIIRFLYYPKQKRKGLFIYVLLDWSYHILPLVLV